MAGIGVSSAVVSFNVALYYNTIIAWCLFYFVQVSIYSPLDSFPNIVNLQLYQRSYLSLLMTVLLFFIIQRKKVCENSVVLYKDFHKNSISLSLGGCRFYAKVCVVACQLKLIVSELCFFQSFQSKLPWAECPNIYFQNGSYAPEPECVVWLMELINASIFNNQDNRVTCD